MPRRLGLPLLVLHRLGVVLFSGELVVDLSSGKVVAAADCDVSRLCFGKKDIFANVKLIQGFSSVGIEEDNTIGRTLIAHIGCVVLVIRSVFKTDQLYTYQAIIRVRDTIVRVHIYLTSISRSTASLHCTLCY
jgi:hypothetical protein